MSVMESSPIARSREFRAALRRAEAAARSDVPVLVHGESGSGKEVLARHVHACSPRRAGPFVPVNAAALPFHLLESELFGHERGAFTGADRARLGMFREADGGTLLIDELGDLPRPLQAKLLRVLQEGEVRPVGASRVVPVDVRLVAATHRDLRELVAAGTFREDLFYRVSVFTVEAPPLRERRDDVVPLAVHFLRLHSAEEREGAWLTDEAEHALLASEWPGNVRELENACRHALVLRPPGRPVGVEHLPPALGRPASDRAASGALWSARSALERELILGALEAVDGNRTRAARRLGISRQALHQQLRRHGIGPGAGRPGSAPCGPDVESPAP